MYISSHNVKSTTSMLVMRVMTSAQEPGHLQADHLRFCSPCFYQGLRKPPPWRHYADNAECGLFKIAQL
jgi:hypothetical protein